jgi:membrane-bound lytic murein transglycosylase D
MLKMRIYVFYTVVLASGIVLGCGSGRSTVQGDQTSKSSVLARSVAADSLLKDSSQSSSVQFLQLTSDSDTLTNTKKQSANDETAATNDVKAHYANALKYWHVDQNAESAKQEYKKALEALVMLGDILSRKEPADDELAPIKDTTSVFPIKFEDAKGDDTKAETDDLTPDPRMEYPNWLAAGIVSHYKNLLELKNEYNEDTFSQQVLSRLFNFDLGLASANASGVVKAPIVKGQALDYIPLNINNERIEKYIQRMTQDNGANIQELYKKYGRYEKIIRDILKQEGVCQDLIYLAMIESGFNVTAKSHARAVGPWQFVTSTARSYGLNVDWWVDDRRDIYLASRAAAHHLKDLFQEFGDWYLALAAYDFGGVYHAIKKNNTRDYWEMKKLPRETKNYLPYFIASATIAKNPSQYGLKLNTDPPLLMDTVTVTECLDLEAIANCVKSTPDSIRDINPALLRWCTPPTASSYLLKVPFGRRAMFIENYAKIPQEKKRSWVRYQVKYGETLSLIGNRFGTDTKAIMQANQLKNAVNLIAGQYILIPVAPKSYVAKSENNSDYRTTNSRTTNYSNTTGSTTSVSKKKEDDKAGKKKITFKVEEGNTLGEIAEWYNILAQNIRDWNGLYYGDPIYPGQVLTLWIDTYIPDEGYRNATKKKAKEDATEEPGTKIYIVQDNDTLTGIAKLFNVEVSSIKRWNKMSSNTIRVGDKLKIFVGQN